MILVRKKLTKFGAVITSDYLAWQNVHSLSAQTTATQIGYPVTV